MVYLDLCFGSRAAVLDEDQIERMCLATLDMLERPGARITRPIDSDMWL